jgi:HAMP domain-containing protein
MDTFITTLFASTPYFDYPQGVIGWLVWFSLFAAQVYLLLRWRKFANPHEQGRRWVFFSLLIFEFITTAFLGIWLPVGNALPLPGTPIQPSGPALMFLAAVPWVLAAGLLGPEQAGMLAFFSGGLLGLLDSHNPFVPFIYMFLAMVLSVMFRQNYRTTIFRFLRSPLVSGTLLILLYPFIYGLFTLFIAGGALAIRLDFVFSIVDSAWLAFAGQMVFGILFAQVIAVGFQQRWRPEAGAVPAPHETSLERRLVNSLMPLSFVFVVLVILLVGGLLANTNRQQMGSRLQNVAQSSAGAIPFGLETGQNLISQLAADPRMQDTENPEALKQVLVEYLNRVPFFTQLTYFDVDNQLVAAYPIEQLEFLFLTPEEQDAMEIAQRGVAFQSYSLQPEPGNTAGRLVFVVAVEGDAGQTGILLGRSRLDQNPFFIPVIENLNSLRDIGGVGMLVDDQGMVLYHPDLAVIGSTYDGEIDFQIPIYDPRHTAADGTREIFYQSPVPGRPWLVITTVPIAFVQQLALQTSLPLFGLLLLLLGLLYVGIRYTLRRMTGSITKLAGEAKRITAGDLDRSLKSTRVDEVGQLANSLDEMRMSLKTRMEEIARLLSVSKGVASALEMEMAVKPILEGALTLEASPQQPGWFWPKRLSRIMSRISALNLG